MSHDGAMLLRAALVMSLMIAALTILCFVNAALELAFGLPGYPAPWEGR